jgi:hypothetical protein
MIETAGSRAMIYVLKKPGDHYSVSAKGNNNNTHIVFHSEKMIASPAESPSYS